MKKLFLAGCLLVGLAGQASAQTASPAPEKGILERLFGLLGGKKEEEQPDSTKVEKVKKPLESYFFDDSLRNRSAFAWTVRPGYNAVVPAEIDTLQYRFETDYPFLLPDVGSAYLGNLGGAALRLNYFERPDANGDFSFLNAYDAYLLTPERAPYFNTKRAFTDLSWYMSGQTARAEEQLRLTHAQNISPSTGFNIYYLNRGTRGQYRRQRARDRNLSLAFGHTGKRYSVFAGYIYNGGQIIENGGLQWDGALGNVEFRRPDEIPVRLTSAQNNFKTNTFYITQAYGIPLQRVSDLDLSIADKSSLFIGHAFEYTAAWRTYIDTRTGAQFPEGDPDLDASRYGEEEGQVPRPATVDYYTGWFIDKDQSLDSLREARVDNKAFIQIQPWNRDGIIGTIDGGIGLTLYRYYASNLHDEYIHGRGTPVRETDTYLYGSVQGKLRRYVDWDARVNYHLAGFRSQDIRLDARLQLSAFIKQHPIRLTVSGFIENRSPGYWMLHTVSNHYLWENSFSKEMETRLEAKLDIPSIGLEAGVRQSLTVDKLYYGYEAGPIVEGAPSSLLKPMQDAGGTLSVTGVYLMKNFRLPLGRADNALHFDHRVLIQKSSDERVIPLPLASAYASYFIDFTVVRNIMRMQVGVSGYYHTKYYAPGYNPALMQFHNQDRLTADAQGNPRARQIGDYPYLDAFVSAKWKRMRVYAKFQHVNQGLFGTADYFTVQHYPLNQQMFKLGFSWNFYD